MRKLSVCLLTAVTAMAAACAAPVTALAGTYSIPGGKMIVVGGMNGLSCDLPGINIPGLNLPGINIPGSNIPDNSLPMPEFPIPDQPGNMLPDRPGDTLPDQPDNMLPNQPDGSIPEQPDAEDSQDAFTRQIVKLVNEERAKAGLQALTADSGVDSAAQTRAKEIASVFSHTRPDGREFSTALTASGVSFSGAGENIAYGQTTPEQVMESWMNSSGHRANILSRDFTSIGVGHYENASGVDYWTQLFTR